jgi:hypothetical protein
MSSCISFKQSTPAEDGFHESKHARLLDGARWTRASTGNQKRWRRLKEVAGAWPVTWPNGVGRRHSARRCYSNRERERRGPGGPVAHHEREEMVGKARGGWTATPWPTTSFRKSRTSGSIGDEWGRFLLRGCCGRQGGAPWLHGGARGGLERRGKTATVGLGFGPAGR